jgi:molybdopterin synthase catalytic subunit
MISVKVLYFAVVRERLRKTHEDITLAEGATVRDLLRALEERHPALGGMRQSLRVAVNEAFVDEGQGLADGDEAALIPPVAGGAPYCRLSAEPLALEEVLRAVGGSAQGGIVSFSGVVRGWSKGRAVARLEYEAYGTMALRTLGALIASIEEAYPGVKVAIVHRTGVLQVGEVAVVIAASAPHRAEAFTACQQAIDRLKQEVPIWKKEVFTDGEEWVGSRP